MISEHIDNGACHLVRRQRYGSRGFLFGQIPINSSASRQLPWIQNGIKNPSVRRQLWTANVKSLSGRKQANKSALFVCGWILVVLHLQTFLDRPRNSGLRCRRLKRDSTMPILCFHLKGRAEGVSASDCVQKNPAVNLLMLHWSPKPLPWALTEQQRHRKVASCHCKRKRC